jgi:transcriptional regulator with XRE-family HTH domain
MSEAMLMPTTKRSTLGSVLDDARKGAGLSVRQLAEAADVPKSEVGRLLRDQQERLNPASLAHLAAALELNATDLFLLAGMPMPRELPSVEALLRTEYDLPEKAVLEAKAQIEAIVDRYQSPKSRTLKGGKK